MLALMKLTTFHSDQSAMDLPGNCLGEAQGLVPCQYLLNVLPNLYLKAEKSC